MEQYPGETYPWYNEHISAQSLVHRHIGFDPTQFNPPEIFKRLLVVVSPGLHPDAGRFDLVER